MVSADQNRQGKLAMVKKLERPSYANIDMIIAADKAKGV